MKADALGRNSPTIKPTKKATLLGRFFDGTRALVVVESPSASGYSAKGSEGLSLLLPLQSELTRDVL